ncbi:hypothetical protein [Streptomyces sp. NPDC002104]
MNGMEVSDLHPGLRRPDCCAHLVGHGDGPFAQFTADRVHPVTPDAIAVDRPAPATAGTAAH